MVIKPRLLSMKHVIMKHPHLWLSMKHVIIKKTSTTQLI